MKRAPRHPLAVASACVLVAACGRDAARAEEGVAVTLDLTRRRFIGGVSALRREAYFNIHGQLREMSREEAELFVGELHASFGRNVGFTTWTMRQVRADPARPGHVDAAMLKRHGKKILAGKSPSPYSNSRKVCDPVYTSHPQSFYPGPDERGAGRGPAKLFAPGDHEAAAEYLELLFRHCLAAPPRYYEVMNEPNVKMRELRTTWEDMCELHRAVARRLRGAFGGMLVGGPTLAWPAFEKKGFGVWTRGMRGFIDLAGADMDFLSLHLYDTHFDDKVMVRTGANTEAILDLVESYSLVRTGKVKPLVISEYGTSFKKGHKVRGAYFPLRDWYILKGVNGKLMQLLDRPDRVLKSIPFIVVRAGWYKAEHPYPWVLYHKRNDGWAPTHLAKFYRLWKNVKGDRVIVRTAEPDLQACAFMDGRTAYLCLNNLEPAEVAVNVTTIPGGAVRIARAAVSRLYSDGEKPVLEEHRPLEGLGRIRLAADEMAVVRIELTREPEWRSAVDERCYYAGRTVAPIKGGPEAFVIDVPPDRGRAVYARLRLGIARAHGLSLAPKVTFGGRELEVRSDEKGGDQASREEYFGAKEIDVPGKYVRERNEVKVSFPEVGGHISSVILMVAHERRP